MISRCEKFKEKKRVKVRNRVKKIIINSLCAITVCISVLIWFFVYDRESQMYELVYPLQSMYLTVFGFYIMITSGKTDILTSIMKAFMKLVFNVWIVLIIMFSSLDSVERNAWIIGSTFFIVYLEALLEISERLQNLKHFKLKKMKKFINHEFIVKNASQISIIVLAVLHSIIPFFLLDVLNDITLNIPGD
jgi:hypothetical protein